MSLLEPHVYVSFKSHLVAFFHAEHQLFLACVIFRIMNLNATYHGQSTPNSDINLFHTHQLLSYFYLFFLILLDNFNNLLLVTFAFLAALDIIPNKVVNQ